MQNNSYRVFLYAALPCEAKALISRLRLQRYAGNGPFACYTHAEICLTVTGVGKNAMAAGVAYSQAKFGNARTPVLLNIGVAGHKSMPLGELAMADKIVDEATDRSFYPVLLFEPPCETLTVVTVSKPQFSYPQPCLYDMEAAAFYEIAVRFSTAELIQCVKVVSDNEDFSADTIKPKQVNAWVSAHVDTLIEILGHLRQLAQKIETNDPRFFRAYMEQWHFTVSQQHQLNQLLSRWQVLTQGKDPGVDFQLQSSKAVLAEMKRKISSLDFSF